MNDLEVSNNVVMIGSTHDRGEILHKSKKNTAVENTKHVTNKVIKGFRVRI